MPRPVKPRAQFITLTESEVLAAVDDPDETNPIASEVARLIEGYTENFRAYVERIGYIPADILHVQPGSPIEAVAMRLTTQAIADTLSRRS